MFEYMIDREDILHWLKNKITVDMNRINLESPIVTDGGTDITEYVRGRLHGYIEVKDYIERGKTGQKK